ncbi:MAG: hypothetical protein CMJ78_26615 [Planctomycetaceae bacterium]|nr:hypothetical protein [Planctomycetaceae bacterium]
MGGKIWANSDPGQGSAFHFTIRLAIGKELEMNETQIDDHKLPEEFGPIRILLAEDTFVEDAPNFVSTESQFEDELEPLEPSIEDLDLLKDLAEMFLDLFPEQLAEVRQSVESGDAGELRRSAHRLKGSVSSLGSTVAAQTLVELEVMGRDDELNQAERVYQRLEAEIRRLERTLQRMGAGSDRFAMLP